MTDEQMIREVYQAMFGVHATDETGMIGDIKDIKKSIRNIYNDQNKLKNRVNSLTYFLLGSGLLAGGTIVKLLIG